MGSNEQFLFQLWFGQKKILTEFSQYENNIQKRDYYEIDNEPVKKLQTSDSVSIKHSKNHRTTNDNDDNDSALYLPGDRGERLRAG